MNNAKVKVEGSTDGGTTWTITIVPETTVTTTVWTKLENTNVSGFNNQSNCKIRISAGYQASATYYVDDISVSATLDETAPTNVGCSTPTNNATGQSTTPTLVAKTAADAGIGLHSTPYYFELATDTNFTQNTQNSGWIANGDSTGWTPGTTLSLSTTYYWRVTTKDTFANTSSACGHTADTVGYGTFTTVATPTVTSITPSVGAKDNTAVSITNLAGTNFTGAPEVKLKKTGETAITATGVTVDSATKITCTFNLTNAAAGAWDVEVTTTGGTATLSSGFTVHSVTVDSATDGTNTITVFDNTKYLKDADTTVSMTLGTTPVAAPTLRYGGDDNPALRGTSVTATLVSGTTYTATISASNENVTDGSSVRFVVIVDGVTCYRTGTSPWAYKVDGVAPTGVACSTPADGAVNQSTSLSLSGTATDSVAGLHSTPYYYQVATDSAFSAGVQNSGWVATTWNPSLSQGVTYYWKVKARDNVGNASDYGSSRSFTTAVGQAASISYATDGTNTIYACDGTENLQDANTTVSIGLSQPTSTVALYYDDVSSPWSGTSATVTGSATSWTATILASDANIYNGATVYFGVNVGGTQYYLTGSTAWSYKVDGAAPENVGCVTPANNAIGVSTTAALTAKTATDDNSKSPTGSLVTGSGLHATPYYFELATNASFTAGLQSSGWQASTSWNPTLAAATTYYWRVKARDKVGNENAWRGHTATASYGTFTTRGMTLALATNYDSYLQCQTIGISGTAKDPRGVPISSGTATIKLLHDGDNWKPPITTQISNGNYSYNYQSSRSDPTGNWTITVTATDNNNTGENSKSITVNVPPTALNYTIQITSPTVGLSCFRGSMVSISVKVTDAENANVSGAQVSFTTPVRGERSLTEMTAGTGIYTGSYTVGWADPTGNWEVVIEAKKTTIENEPRSGLKSLNVEVKPSAAMQVTLKDFPSQVEAGQIVQIKAQALYPDGAPAENATISVITPSGENLTLVYEGNGIYSTTYTITSQDVSVGSWGVELSASDLNGNSGKSPVSTVEVTPMGAGRILTTYWWAFLAVFAAIGTASAYVAWRTILVQRLRKVRKEMKEIPKLKKETMLKYFKEASIERDTYDEMMDKYDMRLEELRKQEMLLSPKVEKRARAKRAKRMRKKG